MIGNFTLGCLGGSLGLLCCASADASGAAIYAACALTLLGCAVEAATGE